MADFYNLNLWMFIVIGVFGYALCWFRWKLVWWILPVVFFVCIAYLFGPSQPHGLSVEYDSVTLFRIGFAMFVALAGPILGALRDHESRHPRRNNLP